jgi:uncharacterized protein
MAVFIALLGLDATIPVLGRGFWFQHPEFWIFPLQTIVCGWLVWRFWRAYDFRPPKRLAIGISIGLVVFAIWIAPQTWLGAAPRTIGFNPDLLAAQPALYWSTVVLRFLRLVVVVPLAEEIFWRGFLLRYLVKEQFDQVPFGTFSWLSFSVVTAAFCLSHSTPDWPAAAITGALYNWIAYRTKSLSTCVIAHAVTNNALAKRHPR